MVRSRRCSCPRLASSPFRARSVPWPPPAPAPPRPPDWSAPNRDDQSEDRLAPARPRRVGQTDRHRGRQHAPNVDRWTDSRGPRRPHGAMDQSKGTETLTWTNHGVPPARCAS
eukprot:1182921-Prorocentrum_minimum.AAC.2